MFDNIENSIKSFLEKKGIESPIVKVEWNLEKSIIADATTTACMKYAKVLNINPKVLAEEIKDSLDGSAPSLSGRAGGGDESIKSIEVAGPGYLNFILSDEFLHKNINKSIEDVKNNIKNLNLNNLKDKVVLVEYTDPNPFKVFHIGHLMTNTIGECIANFYELAGAKVKRVNYQGDVGRHIAINIYAILENLEKYNEVKNINDVKKRVEWLGEMYARGYKDFDNDVEGGEIKIQVKDINKKIYERSDEAINEIYDNGRAWSLEYFEVLYKMLGTKFDKYIFESNAAPIGLDIINNNLNIFEKSDGAIIYDGEQDGLHKRVFINSEGLPTYEAKDLGNMQIKLDAYPDSSLSIVITGNEQNDYFKVLYKVINKILKKELNLAHFGHGMMRFVDGKMSSRKGNILAGDELIYELMDTLRVKFENSRIDNKEEKESVIEKVAIGAIKYSILKQAIGRDVVFDLDNAISIDGDSGPYLQYTYARISGAVSNQIQTPSGTAVPPSQREGLDPGASASLWEPPRAGVGVSAIGGMGLNENKQIETKTRARELILIILRFEDILAESTQNISPQVLSSYLIELAHAYNSFYASEKIRENINNINLSHKVRDILHLGLHTLGIKTPHRM